MPTLGDRVSCDTLVSRQRPVGRRRQRCCVWHRSGLANWDEIVVADRQGVVRFRREFRIGGLAGDNGRSCVAWGGVCWRWRRAGGGAGTFVAMNADVWNVRWSSPDGGGVDDGPERRPWLAERQRPFDATMKVVGLKVGGRCWPRWPLFWLARAQSRMIPPARSQEGYFFVSGSATIALPTDRRTRTTGSISPFFFRISTTYIEELNARLGR